MKPTDIPLHPSNAYKNSGWEGWGDFLGTGYERKSLAEMVSVAENLAKERGSLPDYAELRRLGHVALTGSMERHPEAFKHITQDRKTSSLDDHLLIAEGIANKNGGTLPSIFSLQKQGMNGLVQMIQKHPDKFSHLMKKRLHCLKDHLELASRLVGENDGILPSPTKLKKLGHTALVGSMYTYPAEFAKFKQDMGKINLADAVKQAELLAVQNGNILPSPAFLRKNGYSALYASMRRHTDAFAHISQNKRKWTPK